WQSVLPRLPDSADWLADRIVEHDVKLVILDTLTTFLGTKVDSHRDQDVRRALIPLVKTASESGTAVLAVRHLNKGQQSSAMHRGMGSMAFTGLARAGWHAGPHPDEDAMVLAAVKNNLAQNAHAMRYRVSDRNGAPVVTWEGPCDLVADDLVAQPASTPSAVTEAVEWLEEQLTGREVRSTQLQQDAAEAGISHGTYRRARKHLDVTSTRRADQHWCSLPAQPAQHQVPEQVEQAG
ncbi:MAG: AAA family ATPase, partial [Gemmatimonadales bacterium]|nr:AAA family ATPase [Gemmatimonadales bacterium]